MFETELFMCIKMDLALNNLKSLICHKNQTKKQTRLIAIPRIKSPVCPTYLVIDGWRIFKIIPFPWVLWYAISLVQGLNFFAAPISYDNGRYAMSISIQQREIKGVTLWRKVFCSWKLALSKVLLTLINRRHYFRSNEFRCTEKKSIILWLREYFVAENLLNPKFFFHSLYLSSFLGK